jgi:hypothetical protein
LFGKRILIRAATGTVNKIQARPQQSKASGRKSKPRRKDIQIPGKDFQVLGGMNFV